MCPRRYCVWEKRGSGRQAYDLTTGGISRLQYRCCWGGHCAHRVALLEVWRLIQGDFTFNAPHCHMEMVDRFVRLLMPISLSIAALVSGKSVPSRRIERKRPPSSVSLYHQRLRARNHSSILAEIPPQSAGTCTERSQTAMVRKASGSAWRFRGQSCPRAVPNSSGAVFRTGRLLGLATPSAAG
jgi:hypothetical protein